MSERACVTRGSSLPIGNVVTSSESAGIVSACFERGHQRVVVFHELRGRKIKHRSRRLAESKARELGVGDDADDAECAGEFFQIETEVLVDGVFVALEEAFDEGLIHDGDRRGGFVVGCGEMSPLEHGNAEMLQIVRTDAIPRCARLFVYFAGRMAGDHDEFAPIVGERVVHGDVGAFDTGNAAHIVFEPAGESDLGWQGLL